jgi:hypothetical protein
LQPPQRARAKIDPAHGGVAQFHFGCFFVVNPCVSQLDNPG